MSLLYLAGESELDEDFYAACAEKLTGQDFNWIRLRNRKGAGLDAVRRQMKNAVVMARAAAGGAEPVAFIAAMDNDRAPHPENEVHPPGTGLDRSRLIPEERELESRLEWMTAVVEGVLGQNRKAWPIDVALAVPVEMIESWIVRSRQVQQPQPTPHFSRADSDQARMYYHPSAPPPQWKDLADDEQRRSERTDKRDFHLEVATNLDVDALAGRSVSFQMFKVWLDGWKTVAPAET